MCSGWIRPRGVCIIIQEDEEGVEPALANLLSQYTALGLQFDTEILENRHRLVETNEVVATTTVTVVSGTGDLVGGYICLPVKIVIINLSRHAGGR